MTVDSYWQDGERMHLMRDGVDLSVPRARIRSMKQVEGPVTLPQAPRREAHGAATAASTAAASTAGQPTRAELEAHEAAIAKHLLRVQQERYEARNRGDDAKTLRRLDKEFQRTQARRGDTLRAISRSE
jgi:hypothetical protein